MKIGLLISNTRIRMLLMVSPFCDGGAESGEKAESEGEGGVIF